MADLSPVQANAIVARVLPRGSVVTTTYGADAANAATLKRLPDYSASYMPGTQIVEFTTSSPE